MRAKGREHCRLLALNEKTYAKHYFLTSATETSFPIRHSKREAIWNPASGRPTMLIEKQPAVYILASRYRSTIYTGVTSNLYDRISSHKEKLFHGFSADYNCHQLVWYENHPTMPEAIRRETKSRLGNATGKSNSSKASTAIGGTCTRSSHTAPTHGKSGVPNRPRRAGVWNDDGVGIAETFCDKGHSAQYLVNVPQTVIPNAQRSAAK